MMKAIMMSINPKHVANILNGKKTIELRKKFPKDYVGWVYIYCTKEDNLMKLSNFHNDKFVSGKEYDITNFVYLNSGYEGKGKVVARFWCDKVKRAFNFYPKELCQLACITEEELYKYVNWDTIDDLLAIHITKLEIFDKPKEISEFKRLMKYKSCSICPHLAVSNGVVGNNICKTCEELKPLTRAPQSWCYIEI